MFNTEVYSQDINRAIVYLEKLAERVQRKRIDRQFDHMVMTEADAAMVELHGSAERLAAAIEAVAKARTQVENAAGRGGWSIGIDGGHVPGDPTDN